MPGVFCLYLPIVPDCFLCLQSAHFKKNIVDQQLSYFTITQRDTMNKTTGDLYKVYPESKKVFGAVTKESLWTKIKRFFGFKK